jgi:hypothetical protein
VTHQASPAAGAEPPGQVDHVGWWGGEQRTGDGLVAGGNDRHVRPGESVVGLVGEQPPQVGELGFDVAAVGPDQPGRVYYRIVDAHLVSLADQPLGHLDAGAFAQIVGVGFEAQAQQRHRAGVAGHHPFHHVADDYLVGGQRPGQQRQVHPVAARQLEQRPQVLGQARAAGVHLIEKPSSEMTLMTRLHEVLSAPR